VGAFLAVLAIVAVAVGIYGWSLWRHPWRICLSCKGSGRHAGALGVHGQCRSCHGRKHHVRPDVKMITPGRARKLMAGDRGRYG
jgi:hypothetical protein